MLNLASHMEVLRFAVKAVNHLNVAEEMMAQPPDCKLGDLEAELVMVDATGASGPLVDATAHHRGATTLFARDLSKLPLGKTVARNAADTRLGEEMLTKLDASPVLVVRGRTGVGKSARAPLELLLQDKTPGGLVHHLPQKMAATGLWEFYQKQASPIAAMAGTWNGDYWMFPRQRRFVTLCTAVSLFHRFRQASLWSDVRYLLLDELHCRLALAMLFVQYYVHLLTVRDRRVTHVKLILMSATWAGPAIEAVEQLLRDARVEAESVEVLPEAGRKTYEVLPLWEHVQKPKDWEKLALLQKGCVAANEMAKWLWQKRNQIAQLLFIVPGEKELWEMRNALRTSNIFDFLFELYVITAESSKHETREIRETLERNAFKRNSPVVFLIVTDGQGGKSWSPFCNGVLDDPRMVVMDRVGFKHVVNEDQETETQRKGRAGRVADGLWCRLQEGDCTPAKWIMPYDEQLQVLVCIVK